MHLALHAAAAPLASAPELRSAACRPQHCAHRDTSACAAASQVPGSRLGFDLLPQLASSLVRAGQDSVDVPVLRSSSTGEARTETSGRAYLEFPAREGSQAGEGKPPLIRVRLTVPYRVHSRQMLCIGGSQIPFGWSFLSIAKVPMSWHPNDIWVAEVRPAALCGLRAMLWPVYRSRVLPAQIELPPKSRIEYKYVILEEQARLLLRCPC